MLRLRSTLTLPLKLSLVLLACLASSACFNDNEERKVVLGNVSLGDQLIDLKKAHEAGALSDREYKRLRQGLMALITEQQRDEEDEEDVDSIEEEEEDEDGFSWL